MKTTSGYLPRTCAVAVVGGGTAGLALAAELRRLGDHTVVVLEREKEAGGVPRHCGHYPFGVFEHRRLMKGPDYARRNVAIARKLGVNIQTETTVTALHPNGRLSLATPSGPSELQAERVVLCTGVRESSRAQRFIGGDRPLGVVSTGALQSMVYLQGMRPFQRPVILGSELVSFSAINTCRHAGIRVAAMIEDNDRVIVRRLLQPYTALMGVPLHLGARDIRIIGTERVEAVAFQSASGAPTVIETDGVIISGRFRPEAALIRSSHLALDPGSGGPEIDQYGQCSDPAYYSAGNLLRPAETSAWCWQEGVATARRIADDLTGKNGVRHHTIRLDVRDPAIRFVVPQRLSLSARSGPMEKLQVGLNEAAKGYLVASIDGRQIWRHRINSRPVRRVLMPLSDIVAAKPEDDVELTIQRER